MGASRFSRPVVFTARVGWLILPVVSAGLVHVGALKLNLLSGLAVPLDRGVRWRGRSLFGAHKTWRGVVLMVTCTAVFTRVQAALEQRRGGGGCGVVAEYLVNPWIAGGLMGFGYCLAELPNSFLKRQLDIPPGGRSARATTLHYLVDQTDSVAGCILILRLFYRPRRGETLAAFVLGTAIHVAVDRLLYAIGVKRGD